MAFERSTVIDLAGIMCGDIVKSGDPKAKGEEGGIEGDKEGAAYGGDLGQV